jgi:hypothetical protein
VWWTILASLVQNELDHDIWLFWCVVESSLQLCFSFFPTSLLSFSFFLSVLRFELTAFVFETRSTYVAWTGLKLKILLPPLPECWDYRCAHQHTWLLYFFLICQQDIFLCRCFPLCIIQLTVVPSWWKGKSLILSLYTSTFKTHNLPLFTMKLISMALLNCNQPQSENIKWCLANNNQKRKKV